jgi:signal transduction histidine kinase
VSRSLVRQPEFWTTLGAVVALTAGHYAAPMHDPFWHDLFRRLYYLPVILAAFRYGIVGGVLTPAVVTAAFIPHVLMARQMLPKQASEAVFEIPLYFVVGAVLGLLADRQRRANESLRRAERLRVVGEMAAGMAHEVKNPLAAIRSSAQILAGRVAGKDAEFAQLVVTEVDRLNRVVNDFLQYARPAPLERVPVLLSALARSCVELLAPVSAGRGVTVVTSFPNDERPVSADQSQLRQVLLNLLLNAIEASAPGSDVELAVEQSGRVAAVRVLDHGPGIAADGIKQAFEPFFTTKPGGTGLGLAIAQRIVAEHGGRLTIESKVGSGATALVSLPVE